MRPFKLGLSRPKEKKKDIQEEPQENIQFKPDTSETDEINASRDTISDISDSHFRRATKLESKSHANSSHNNKEKLKHESQIESNMSITDLVNKVTKKDNQIRLEPAETYDLENNFKPVAGPSRFNKNKDVPSQSTDNSIMDTDSSQEDNKGIMSFYASKVFDSSLEIDTSRVLSENNPQNVDIEREIEPTITIQNTGTSLISKNVVENCKIVKVKSSEVATKTITPKIKPPTKNYIISTLEKYNIPKVIHTVVPYYSDHKDVGDKVEIGQMVLKLQSKLAKDQKPFEKVLDTISIEEWRQLLFLQTNEMSQESAKPEALKALLAGNKNFILEPVNRPPTRRKVVEWIQKHNEIKTEKITEDNKSKIIEELDNSQALGLHEDEINNSISLESNDKVKFHYL